jgi:hypothetical protein
VHPTLAALSFWAPWSFIPPCAAAIARLHGKDSFLENYYFNVKNWYKWGKYENVWTSKKEVRELVELWEEES